MHKSSCFFILCCLLLIGALPQGYAASATAAKKVHQQAPASVKSASLSPLERLQNDFAQLKNDPKRNALRHHWLALEDRAEAFLKKNSKNAEALLFAAQCRESLAQRSQTKADYKATAEKYKRFTQRLPRHAQTPEMLYKQAALLAEKNIDSDEMHKVIATLTKQHASSPYAQKAQELAIKYPKAAPGNSAAKKAVEPAEKAASTAEKNTTKQSAKSAATNKSVAQQLGLGIKTVVIDAGHGGKDPGTMDNGIEEKEFTLKIAKALGAKLQQQGLSVIYTRNNDTFISLQDRPVIANNKKADLFISIHINANTKHDIRGLETYYLDVAKTAGAASVAARENGVTIKELSNLQFILADLMLGSKLTESRQLATAVQKAILTALKKSKFTLPDNGVRAAPFHVLLGAKMPAILVECGYVTNAEDAQLLKNNQFLEKQVEGLAEGIVTYKRKVERVGLR